MVVGSARREAARCALCRETTARRSHSQVRKLQATWRAAVLPSVHSVLFLKP